MNSLINKKIGNYTTQSYLGSGGFSAVFTAVHDFTKEKVALKIAKTNDRQLIEEYNKIVKSGLTGLLKISHPNIIGIREYFIASVNDLDYFVLVLDLIDGQSLDKTPGIEEMPIKDKLKLFIKVCDAIQYAHNFEYMNNHEFHSYKIKGIFHGDIKPANIMLDSELEPKVIDFSLLNFKRPESESLEASNGDGINTGMFGTPGFMAPEQETGRSINEKTDIFSLGIVLKQLIFGFKSENPFPQNPAQLKLIKIIETATQPNPNQRYDSVGALLKDIEKLNQPIVLSGRTKWASLAASLLILVASFFLFNKKPEQLNRTVSDNINLNSSLSPEGARGAQTIGSSNSTDLDINKNKYYALLIGNNEYHHWTKLKYPLSDISQIKKTLIENYTFDGENIKTIENGTYDKIYKAFESFTDSGPNSFLFIYYAGHGKYDEVTNKAALIPVDAETGSDSKNLTSDLIRDLLKKCSVQNILFISDACYLGAMASRGESKDSLTRPNVSTFKSFASKKSRKFISSGAKETVPDKSFFNEYLIKYLKNNPNDIVFEHSIYNDIMEPIQRNSEATPVFGVCFDTRDEGGHFYLMKRKN